MTIISKGKVISLDLGEKRIGLAVCDEDRILAQPLCTINRKGREKDIAAIIHLAQEQKANLIVIGFPRQADDSLGVSALKVLKFSSRLKRVSGLTLAFVDEWETTVEANEYLLRADVSRKRRKQIVDKLAASLILKRFLEKGALSGINLEDLPDE